MTRAAMRHLAAPLYAVILTAASAGQVLAQAVITGRVVNEQGTPLVGANVFVQGSSIGAQTNANGTYTVNVPAERVDNNRAVLVARYIGYTPQERAINMTPGTQTQNFTLRADPFRLDEVVVTGVAEATSQRKLTFSVARVSEEQLKEVPAGSPVSALAGKVSGARITPGRGTPGSQPAIRLRGSTSLNVGGSQPLIIVDGVITRYNISDIDANDIESIEVLKGAAAASFYGSDAANGVVAITTKRGRNSEEGKVTFVLRNEYGQSGLERLVPLNEHHAYQLNPDGSIALVNGARVTVADQIHDNPYPSSGPNRFRNQLDEWLTNGSFWSTNLQIGLRRGNTNLATSYTHDRNQGVLPLTNGLTRQNLRLNVDQGLTSKIDLSASVTYALNNSDFNPDLSVGQADQGFNEGEQNTFFALLQAPPDLDLRRPNGNDPVDFFPRLPPAIVANSRGNPLYQLANEDYRLRRERMLGSFSARYRPTDWLRLEGSYGTDRLNRQDKTYRFKGYLSSSGTPGTGSLTRFSQSNVSQNGQVSATATKLWMGDLLSTTRVAYLNELTDDESQTAGGTRLVVGQTPDLASVDPTSASVNSNFARARTINYLASQSLDLKDRYLLDLLYRRDGSSLFGPNERWQDFYRVSGAYRISEDFAIPRVQELKVRAARGTAGLRPRFADQYEAYTLLNGQFNKNQIGNKNLRPAIQTEDEYGLNLSFLDRFDLELVQANRVTRGAFLTVPLSAAQTGGYFIQVQNAADVSAKTTEMSLQTRVINRPSLTYSLGLTADRTRQRIDEMGPAPFRVNAGGQSQNVFFYKEGEPLGMIYGARWVKTFAELQETCAKAPTTAGCSAAPVASDYVVNPLGYLVLRAQRGQPGERPIPYTNSQGQKEFKIGDVNPDFNFGITNNVRWNAFGVYALIDGQRGGDIYNFTKHWMFQDLRHGDIDQSGKPQAEQIAEGFYSLGLYNGLNANEYFVEDGSFVKLRELSVSYQVPTRVLNLVGAGRFATGAKIAFIGRNLFTWTNYSGFDPDVAAGNDFNFRIDGFRYPNLRTLTGQLELTF